MISPTLLHVRCASTAATKCRNSTSAFRTGADVLEELRPCDLALLALAPSFIYLYSCSCWLLSPRWFKRLQCDFGVPPFLSSTTSLLARATHDGRWISKGYFEEQGVLSSRDALWVGSRRYWCCPFCVSSAPKARGVERIGARLTSLSTPTVQWQGVWPIEQKVALGMTVFSALLFAAATAHGLLRELAPTKRIWSVLWIMVVSD